jgi:hypothetical protein
MRKLFGKTGLLAATAALVVLAIAASFAPSVAQAQTYYGWNPNTGLEVTHGADVSGGVMPALTFSTGCGTVISKAGGATAGTFTLGTFATSCTITITFPSAAPNGWFCTFNDLTTPADIPKQASTSTTTCVTTAGTQVTGDTILFNAVGY